MRQTALIVRVLRWFVAAEAFSRSLSTYNPFPPQMHQGSTMLVLSRRPDEKILLPTVPAILKVISAQAGLVRLGIEAPEHVPILREELCRGDRGIVMPQAADTPKGPDEGPLSLLHAVRNHLNNLILGLTLLRMHLVDCDPAVRKTLDGIDDELQALRRRVATPLADPPARDSPERAASASA
jgi:carbon storage regulator CsrA